MILLERRGLCTLGTYINIYCRISAPLREGQRRKLEKGDMGVGRCKQEGVQKGGKRWEED